MQEGKRPARIYQADSRSMPEVAAASVALIVTSPPYWRIKDYGEPGQIGHGQTLHQYLGDLLTVWRECFRVGRPGSRLCVNIGDQFARASEYGRYRVIPLHAEIICQCAACGYDYLGSIVWRKKTTMNTSGGAVVMGSYPYPPNGIVEIDFEYILLFKKPGARPPVPAALRASAAMTREEWKSWFSGHWSVAGARKKGHEASFPEEIPRRLIRMFSLPRGHGPRSFPGHRHDGARGGRARARRPRVRDLPGVRAPCPGASAEGGHRDRCHDARAGA